MDLVFPEDKMDGVLHRWSEELYHVNLSLKCPQIIRRTLHVPMHYIKEN